VFFSYGKRKNSEALAGSKSSFLPALCGPLAPLIAAAFWRRAVLSAFRLRRHVGLRTTVERNIYNVA
jgi:hypothetical protein